MDNQLTPKMMEDLRHILWQIAAQFSTKLKTSDGIKESSMIARKIVQFLGMEYDHQEKDTADIMSGMFVALSWYADAMSQALKLVDERKVNGTN